MNDTLPPQSTTDCLFEIASSQHGYFTSSQAEECGVSASLLTYHTRKGQYLRAARGVYRIKNYPTSPREEIVVAWLAIGKDKAVVSHESALDLHDLSDVIPNAVHLTVPRSLRTVPKLPGVRVHTTTQQLTNAEVTIRDGIRVTSIPRTIVDTAATGVGPEQIKIAIQQALQRGQTTRRRILDATRHQSQRVQQLIELALRESMP
jgi:predicted transcriptional regulator of viral defense system